MQDIFNLVVTAAATLSVLASAGLGDTSDLPRSVLVGLTIIAGVGWFLVFS